MTTLAIAIKNIRRKPFRSSALMLSVALVAALIFAGAISMKGVLNSITLGARKLGADLMVVPEGHEDKVRTTLIAGKPSVYYMSNDVLEKVRKIKGVKQASPQLFIKATDYPCCTTVEAILIAFDPASDFTVTPWLKETIDRPLGKNEVIIGRSMPVGKGDTMKFYGKELTVAGHLAETGFDFIDHGVFMSFETAIDMIHTSKQAAEEPLHISEDAISTVLVQLDPSLSPERASVHMEYEIRGVQAIASQDVVGAVKAQLMVLLQVLAGVAFSLWLVTLVLIAVVFSMIVNERQGEIGILRALGARKKTVFTLITLEAVMLSALGGLVGIAAGGGFLYALRKPVMTAFKLPYLWPDILFVQWVGLATLILAMFTGMIAVLYPAFRCSKMEPYEAIRKGA